jgi:hypothetical protein
MTLKEQRAKLEAKQDALAEIFKKAKNDQGDYDFDRVEIEGAKTSQEKLAKVNAMNAELNELFDECEKLAKAEGGWNNHQDRLKESNNGLPLPNQNGDKGNKGGKGDTKDQKAYKDLGSQFIECKAYKAYIEQRQEGVVSTLDWGLSELKVLNSLSAYEVKTLFERGAGWSPESLRLPGFVEKATRPVQLLDIIPTGGTTSSAIKFMEETTRTHNAAERAEGTAFAESVFAMTERTMPVEKVTDSVPVTDEQLEDVAQAESYLTERLQFGLRQRVDTQSAVGDGISPNLKGILAHSIQTQAKGADPTPDAFYKAMTKIRFTGRAMPTNIVIHPNDWQDVRLLRTADGIYIWGSPSEAGPERMWGLPVVQNDALTEGTALVGSFLPPWIMLFNKRGIDVQVGYINDQFSKGIRTIRADLRAALVVFRAAAFASVTGI